MAGRAGTWWAGTTRRAACARTGRLGSTERCSSSSASSLPNHCGMTREPPRFPPPSLLVLLSPLPSRDLCPVQGHPPPPSFPPAASGSVATPSAERLALSAERALPPRKSGKQDACEELACLGFCEVPPKEQNYLKIEE